MIELARLLVAAVLGAAIQVAAHAYLREHPREPQPTTYCLISTIGMASAATALAVMAGHAWGVVAAWAIGVAGYAAVAWLYRRWEERNKEHEALWSVWQAALVEKATTSNGDEGDR